MTSKCDAAEVARHGRVSERSRFKVSGGAAARCSALSAAGLIWEKGGVAAFNGTDEDGEVV
eukprot:10175342-Karenia_brevis.AAC.1